MALLKTFLGIDLKTGGQVILWTHFMENCIIFLVISMKPHVIGERKLNDMIEFPNNTKIGKIVLLSVEIEFLFTKNNF